MVCDVHVYLSTDPNTMSKLPISATRSHIMSPLVSMSKIIVCRKSQHLILFLCHDCVVAIVNEYSPLLASIDFAANPCVVRSAKFANVYIRFSIVASMQ